VSAERVMGYEDRLFDTERVHTIDIVSTDWDSFIETCENEEYIEVALVIDGESYKNVGIRAKGNTSLSSVRSMNSSRYSFKIEFDHYDSTKSYHGLDKLSLNNLIQDNTMMKDYLTYRLMNEFGVASPLCSFVYITVNGEDWGLYLAVEGVEDAFLERTHNSEGELYKPDSQSMGGGRGNGRDFDMNNFIDENFSSEEGTQRNNRFEGFIPPEIQMPEDFDPSQQANGEMSVGNMTRPEEGFNMPQMGGGRGGMGSDDVKLKYIDDNPDSYSSIFENAKTDVSDEDAARLISSLKALSEGDVSVVDRESVMRYFVVHDFVVNGDSYTGSIIHNYYLHERDGILSMIPWDYNLAFGSFQSSNSKNSVNSPIDSPVSGNESDRPMVAWIFKSEEYTARYHELYSEFISSVDPSEIIDSAYTLIAPFVENDPSKFCTYEDFEKGVEALKLFCTLRRESVSGQLNGTIPSTSAGQTADSSSLIDTGSLNTSDTGSMGMGGGFNREDRNFGKGTTEGEQAFPSGGMQRPNTTEGEQAFPSGGMQRPNTTEGEQAFPSGGMQRPDSTQGEQNIPTKNQGQNFSKRQGINNSPENDYSASLIAVIVCVIVLVIGAVTVKVYKR